MNRLFMRFFRLVDNLNLLWSDSPTHATQPFTWWEIFPTAALQGIVFAEQFSFQPWKFITCDHKWEPVSDVVAGLQPTDVTDIVGFCWLRSTGHLFVRVLSIILHNNLYIAPARVSMHTLSFGIRDLSPIMSTVKWNIVRETLNGCIATASFHADLICCIHFFAYYLQLNWSWCQQVLEAQLHHIYWICVFSAVSRIQIQSLHGITGEQLVNKSPRWWSCAQSHAHTHYTIMYSLIHLITNLLTRSLARSCIRSFCQRVPHSLAHTYSLAKLTHYIFFGQLIVESLFSII